MRALRALLAGCLLVGALRAGSDGRTTLTGQVVCSSCWDEAADRHEERYGTKEDLECAARCERKGIAAALAVDEGKDFAVYDLEPGAFKREGGTWMAYMGKQVEVTGRLSDKKAKGKRPRFVVDALKVVGK